LLNDLLRCVAASLHVVPSSFPQPRASDSHKTWISPRGSGQRDFAFLTDLTASAVEIDAFFRERAQAELDI